jgi:hypothetical protein
MLPLINANWIKLVVNISFFGYFCRIADCVAQASVAERPSSAPAWHARSRSA